jgi:hypothetical protein
VGVRGLPAVGEDADVTMAAPPPPPTAARVSCVRLGEETWVAAYALVTGEWHRVPGVFRSEREAAAVAADALERAEPAP